MLLSKTRKSQYDRTTQHSRFVAVATRPLAHFASAARYGKTSAMLGTLGDILSQKGVVK